MFNLQKYILLLMLILSSCATLFQPEKVSMNIDLITVDVDEQPVNAGVRARSSSSKLETL